MKRNLVIVLIAIGVAAGIGIGLYVGKEGEKVSKGAIKDVQQFGVGPTRNVKALLAEDPVLYVGTSQGIVRYNTQDGQHMVFDNKNSGLVSNGIFYLTKIDNKLWVGTYGGGLSIFDGEKWKTYNIPQGLADAFVYGAAKAPNGDIWIATWSGANQIIGGKLDDPKAWKTYTVKNTNGGLPNDWVYSVIVDPKGNVWFGTEGGLAFYDGSKWKNWNHKDGLGAPYEKVKDTLTKDTDPATLSKHHARQKVEMGLEKMQAPYNPNYIVSMLLDSKGRIWCGTWGGGLSVFENGKFKTYTTSEGLIGNYVPMLKEGPDGAIWIGQNKGLSKLKEGMFGSKFINYTKEGGLYGDIVFSMAFMQNGSVWVGSFGGASNFTKGIK
ncbi:MAG: regulator [Nitrospirae bacterium]|nr:regulator [Nitrospirota bacterium]